MAAAPRMDFALISPASNRRQKAPALGETTKRLLPIHYATVFFWESDEPRQFGHAATGRFDVEPSEAPPRGAPDQAAADDEPRGRECENRLERSTTYVQCCPTRPAGRAFEAP